MVDNLFTIIREQQKIILMQMKDIQDMRKKIAKYDMYLSLDSLTAINTFAKIVGVSKKSLLNALKEEGIFHHTKDLKLIPKDKYIEQGLFYIKPYSIRKNKAGDLIESYKIWITKEGVDFLLTEVVKKIKK